MHVVGLCIYLLVYKCTVVSLIDLNKTIKHRQLFYRDSPNLLRVCYAINSDFFIVGETADFDRSILFMVIVLVLWGLSS